jgi:hypothetical protein
MHIFTRVPKRNGQLVEIKKSLVYITFHLISCRLRHIQLLQPNKSLQVMPTAVMAAAYAPAPPAAGIPEHVAFGFEHYLGDLIRWFVCWYTIVAPGPFNSGF